MLLSNQCITQEPGTKNFNKHVVVKGETSYGIAKKYNIDLKVFFDVNPEAANGINKGQVLNIPKTNTLNFKVNLNNIDSSSNKHHVKTGETLWSIAKLYGVKVKVISQYNQLSSYDIELNQLLLIPNVKSDTINVVSPLVKHPTHPLLSPCDTLIIHKVKRKETLYGIASNYSVSIERIIKNNPLLNSKGLKKDQKLKIIYKIIDCNQDSLLKYSDTIVSVSHSQFIEDNLNIAVILPFLLDESDSILSKCEDPELCPLNKKTVKSLKILNGIQLALKELKSHGYNLNVKVFDSEYDTSKIKLIIADSIFKSSHLIIGPIYSKNIKLVRTYARTKNIPMITSFDIPNQALFRYPNLYKFHPSIATQTKSLAQYFKTVKSNYNLVLLTNNDDKKSISYGNIFASEFNDTTITFDSSKVFDSIKPLNLKRGDNFYNVKKHLSRKDTNLIIICANDVPFMTYAFNKVIELSNTKDYFKFNFTVAGFEDLFNMSTIDNIYKNKFNLHFVAKGLIDNSSNLISKFKQSYLDSFQMQFDKTSIIAYDLTMSIFNTVYPSKNNTEIYNGLFNNVYYQKIGPNSGFENKSVKLFRYNNYKLFQIFEN